MIVREIVLLPALPLLFIMGTICADDWCIFKSVYYHFVCRTCLHSDGRSSGSNPGRMREIKGLMAIRKPVAIWGYCFLRMSYAMAASTTNTVVIWLDFFLATTCDNRNLLLFHGFLAHCCFIKFANVKRLYWHHFWLLSISEGVVRLRENARMFFIVTMVSTIAFMSVGILASLTSFASQYREMHPLGLVYKSEPGNELEREAY